MEADRLQVFEDNRDIVSKCVRPYRYYSTREDILQEANLALWEAVASFDGTKGVILRKWLYFMVRFRLIDAVRRWSYVGLGRDFDGDYMKRMKARFFSHLKGRYVEASDGRPRQLRAFREERTEPGGKTHPHIVPFVDPWPSLHSLMAANDIIQGTRTLTNKERAAITMITQDYLLKEIGSALGVNESRACQIVKSATIKMRKHPDVESPVW